MHEGRKKLNKKKNQFVKTEFLLRVHWIIASTSKESKHCRVIILCKVKNYYFMNILKLKKKENKIMNIGFEKAERIYTKSE